MNVHRLTKPKFLFLVILTLTLSSWAIITGAKAEGVPPRTVLQTASGFMSWVEKGRYSIRFGLKGDSRVFQYHSKAGLMGKVYDGLAGNPQPLVTLLVDAKGSPTSSFGFQQEFPVYEVQVSGKPLRTYQEVQDAWRSDNRLAFSLGIVIAFVGSFLCFLVYNNPE